MAWRAWFTQDNTQGVASSGLETMNRAVRLIVEPGVLPNRATLEAVRREWKPNLSAAKLAEIVLSDVDGPD